MMAGRRGFGSPVPTSRIRPVHVGRRQQPSKCRHLHALVRTIRVNVAVPSRGESDMSSSKINNRAGNHSRRHGLRVRLSTRCWLGAMTISCSSKIKSPGSIDGMRFRQQAVGNIQSSNSISELKMTTAGPSRGPIAHARVALYRAARKGRATEPRQGGSRPMRVTIAPAATRGTPT